MKDAATSSLLYLAALSIALLMLAACQPVTREAAVAPAPAAPTPAPAAESQPVTRTAPVLAEWEITVPQRLGFGFDSVWVPSATLGTTTRIDPATNQVVAVIENTGSYSHEAEVVGDSVWLPGEYDNTSRIDPNTNAVAARVKGSYQYLAEGFGSLWGTSKDTLNRIDPATGEVIASIQFSDDGRIDCNNVVYTSAAAVWIDQCDEQQWIKINPTDNRVAARTAYSDLIAQAEAQQALPAGKGGDYMWMVLGDGLLRLDPVTGEGLSFLPLTGEQNSSWGFPPVVTDDSVWVPGRGQIVQVDVPTNQIVATYTVDLNGETRLGAGYGSLWASYVRQGRVQRLDIAP